MVHFSSSLGSEQIEINLNLKAFKTFMKRVRMKF